jgi:hypothetical protein
MCSSWPLRFAVYSSGGNLSQRSSCWQWGGICAFPFRTATSRSCLPSGACAPITSPSGGGSSAMALGVAGILALPLSISPLYRIQMSWLAWPVNFWRISMGNVCMGHRRIWQRLASISGKDRALENLVAVDILRPFHHSTTPPLHHSTTPPLHHSTTPPLLHR